MIDDPEIRQQAYNYFITESQELLQMIEQELLTLEEDYSTAKIHSIMRAAHTIKGGAANVELETIKTVAHSLEDIFRGLYNPDIVFDQELMGLLLEAYECLQVPLMAEMMGNSINENEVLERSASVFAKLQDKLGDSFGDQAHIPTSVELGFDIAKSIFEVGVAQRIDTIAQTIDQGDPDALIEVLHNESEVLIGLAESLNLPGFKSIAQATIAALDAHPDNVLKIAEVALADYKKGRQLVLEGDREQGGKPSTTLQKLAQGEVVIGDLEEEEKPTYEERKTVEQQFLRDLYPESLKSELKRFSEVASKSEQPEKVKFYREIFDYIFGWFYQTKDLEIEELNLRILFESKLLENTEYIGEWLDFFIDVIEGENDKNSLRSYRKWGVFAAVACLNKYANNNNEEIKNYLQKLVQKAGKEYKDNVAVSQKEKEQFFSEKSQQFLLATKQKEAEEEDLLESIWGLDNLDEEALISLEDDGENQAKSSSLVTTNQEDKLEKTTPIKVVQEEKIPEIKATLDTPKETELKIETETFKPEQKGQKETNLTNQYVRVDVQSLERLNYLAGELLINQNRQALEDEKIREAAQELLMNLQKHQQTLNKLRDASELAGISQAIKKNQVKLSENNGDSSVSTLVLQKQDINQKLVLAGFDALELDQYTEFHIELHSALQETVQLEKTTELIELLTKDLTQTLEKQQRLLANVRDDLFEARMLPIGNLLSRFTQMVEKLAKVYGKLVELKVTGTEVLVDKAIAEKLYAPLLQLVRNAFDHGIELPEERKQKGKSEKGIIEIRAYNQGSQAVIEVRDDGKGLNYERIRRRGIDAGLLPNDPLAGGKGPAPSREELTELLFQSGFSTAPQLSEISGRGVGLDIVRSQIEALKGSVSIQSTPQGGTAFILQIPFSMTTAKLMLVQAEGTTYALLLDRIEKIVLPLKDQVKETEGKKVLHWDTGGDRQIIGVRNISDLMRYNRRIVQKMIYDRETAPMKPLLLIRSQRELMALEVDDIIGEQELVIRPVGSTILPPDYVCGSTVMGDGSLVLVIDSSVLVDNAIGTTPSNLLSESYTPTRLLPGGSQEEQSLLVSELESVGNQGAKFPNQLNRVLVVDDAISVRQTLSMTLEKSGYQVCQAEDGIDALDQLRKNPEVGVIVCDLEMPRMNGFEVLSNIAQDPVLSKIPVVILTSRSSEKHKKLAQELGATAYFTKPYSQQEFMAKLQEVMKKK
jgi:two-component system, chemotaxis family, sensor histidine kinase and response regulator PixL